MERKTKNNQKLMINFLPSLSKFLFYLRIVTVASLSLSQPSLQAAEQFLINIALIAFGQLKLSNTPTAFRMKLKPWSTWQVHPYFGSVSFQLHSRSNGLLSTHTGQFFPYSVYNAIPFPEPLMIGKTGPSPGKPHLLRMFLPHAHHPMLCSIIPLSRLGLTSESIFSVLSLSWEDSKH